MELNIRPVTEADLAEIKSWTRQESAPAEYVGAYNPAREALNLADTRNGWGAWDGTELVAFASIAELEARQARIGFIVKPSRRRQGIAKTFLLDLLEREELNIYAKIIATPHLSDIATHKTLARAGFYQTGTNDNGQAVYERR